MMMMYLVYVTLQLFKSGKIASCILGYLLAIKAKYVLNFYEGE